MGTWCSKSMKSPKSRESIKQGTALSLTMDLMDSKPSSTFIFIFWEESNSLGLQDDTLKIFYYLRFHKISFSDQIKSYMLAVMIKNYTKDERVVKMNQLIPACCNLVTKLWILLSLILISCSILLILSSKISIVLLSSLIVLSFSSTTSLSYWFWLIFLNYCSRETSDFS